MDTRKAAIPVTPVLQMTEAQYIRTHYTITAAKGLRPTDVVAQGYWANVAARLKPWDRIEIVAEDGTWLMDVVVMEASRVWARVFPTSGPHFLTAADVAQTQAAQANAAPTPPTATDAPRAPAQRREDFDIVHRGPRKWSVVRNADREVMHEDEQLKAGAADWLADYLARQGAAVAA